MELEINQKIQYIDMEQIRTAQPGCNGPSLAMLMAVLYPESTDGMAVALEHKVIAKADWPVTFLKEKDKLLILTAAQGG